MANRTLMKLVRRATLSGAAIVAIGVTGGGLNQSPAAIPDDPFAGLVPMTDASLASRRGGISAPAVPFGLNINLGGNLVARIDGTVVLTTVFTIADVVTAIHTVSAVTLPNFGDQAVTFVESDGSGTSVTVGVTVDGTGQVSVPDGFVGAVIPDPDGGVVAVLQRFTTDQIAHLAISTATGKTVSSDLNLVVSVSGFASVQGGQAFSNLLVNLNQDLKTAILGGLN